MNDASTAGTPAGFVCPLPDFGLLRVVGDDAVSFLHGQFTCDVAGIGIGHSRYGGYCTPKGRLLATFLLIRDAAGFYLFLPAALREPIRKRLSMYVLRAKVSITDVTHEFRCYGVRGADAAGAAGLASIPSALHEAVEDAGMTAVRVPVDRLLVVAPSAVAIDATAAPACWTALDIEAGIPVILPETQEAFVPQMTNLDLIGGVSFNKGCYPGQEIVARMHYLGKLKERMFRIRLEDATVPAPNTPLFAPNFGNQAAGAVVQAVAGSTGGGQALAVVQTSSAAAGELHLGTPDGPTVSLLDLPYGG